MVAARLALDPTGNWSGYVQKISGSTQLNQSRTHNAVNEVTNITETVGPAWATPAHDRAGNMTTVPDPLGLTAGLTCKYDAWNRLVEVKDGNEVIAQYEYLCPCQLPGGGFSPRRWVWGLLFGCVGGACRASPGFLPRGIMVVAW